MKDYMFEILLVGGGINRKIKLCKRIQKHIEEYWEAEEKEI